MDDVLAIGDPDTIRKGIRNCRKMETEKKIIYGLKKTKYMTIITGREKLEQIEGEVKEGKIDEVDTYSYLGITLSKEQEYIKETENKASRIIREINGISLKAWGKISKKEMQAIEKIQNQSLKKFLQLPVTTASTGLLMETGIWPAKDVNP